jgi:cytochrome c2
MQSSAFIRLAVTLLMVFSSAVSGDEVEKGRDVYLSYCVACHAFSCNRDGADAYSPKLSGLIGRKAGGLGDFTGYSQGLKNSEVIWDDETLKSFFMTPSTVIPEMEGQEYHKVGKSDEVRQLIAYLKTEDPSVNYLCVE